MFTAGKQSCEMHIFHVYGSPLHALLSLYCIVMLLMFLSCPTWAHSYGNKNIVLYCIVYTHLNLLVVLELGMATENKGSLETECNEHTKQTS